MVATPSPHRAIIDRAAEEMLVPAGLLRAGRSRRWFCDGGYFLIEVEFQPHSWRKGTFCNMAVVFLWERPEEGEDEPLRWDACCRLHFSGKVRKALGDSQFIAYEGDDEVFRRRCLTMMREVVRRVDRLRQMTDLTYARYYVDGIDDTMSRSRLRYFLSMLAKLAGEEGDEVRRRMIKGIARRRERIRGVRAYRKLPEAFVVLEPGRGPFAESRSWKRRLQRFFFGY